MVSVDEDEDVQFHIPSPKVTTYGLSYNFDTPLSLPQLWDSAEKESDTQSSETDSGEDVQDKETEAAHVTLRAGITGGLAHPVKKVTIQYEDGTEKEEAVRCNGKALFGFSLTIFLDHNAANFGSPELPIGS
jgi:DnaJ family protein C protein 11